MARTRLTTRIASLKQRKAKIQKARIASLKQRKAESQKDGLFPGDVGNMERSKNYHDIDEYHTFEQTVNHELPDMRHEWKDNPREETGHGIPKMAKVYMAAKKATKLAMIMLGDDASEEMITAQARDFMRMGGTALSASINRWAEMEEKTEETPSEETPSEETPVACEEQKEGCNCADDAEVTAPVGDDATEEAPVADDEETVTEEDSAKEETVANEDEDETTEEAPVADDEEDVEVDEGLIPTEIEFDEAEEGEVESDPELEDLFTDAEEDDNNEVAPVEEETVARKAGIKRLAAQPKLVRVAAKKGADELAGIWSKWESPTLC